MRSQLCEDDCEMPQFPPTHLPQWFNFPVYWVCQNLNQFSVITDLFMSPHKEKSDITGYAQKGWIEGNKNDFFFETFRRMCKLILTPYWIDGYEIYCHQSGNTCSLSEENLYTQTSRK